MEPFFFWRHISRSLSGLSRECIWRASRPNYELKKQTNKHKNKRVQSTHTDDHEAWRLSKVYTLIFVVLQPIIVRCLNGAAQRINIVSVDRSFSNHSTLGFGTWFRLCWQRDVTITYSVVWELSVSAVLQKLRWWSSPGTGWPEYPNSHSRCLISTRLYYGQAANNSVCWSGQTCVKVT